MEKKYRYDAFISYRHISPDKAIADKLQKMLENYRPPKNVGKKKDKWHIFRDETELPTSSNLGNDIKDALENSEFLIVVCSKTTAQSRWCMDEIRYFKELHDGNNAKILTIVADGTPVEVFPPELCNELVPQKDADGNITYVNRLIEPLAANVASPTEKEALKKLKSEFLRIAAPMLGCSYDSLYKREQKKKIKRILTLGSAALISLLTFSLYNGAMLLKINKQNDELLQTNRELNIKNSEILANQAQIYYDSGDYFEAIEAALQAMPEDETLPANIAAERIISEAAALYHNGSRVYCTDVKLSGYVKSLEFSDDGRRIIASDSTGNIYLIDSKESEIIKIFKPENLFGADNSGRMPETCIESEKAYILCKNHCVAVSLETGEILWEFKDDPLNDYYDVISNESADRVFLAGYSHYAVLNGKGEQLYLGTDENSNYKYSVLDGMVFLTDDGTAYICNSTNGTICSINEAFSEAIYDKLAEGSSMLSAYEDDKALYFACKIGDKKVKLVCLNKDDRSVRWENEFSTNLYINSYSCSLFECGYMVQAEEGFDIESTVLFRNGRELLGFDIENGIQEYNFILDEEVLFCEPTDKSRAVRMAVPSKFGNNVILLKGGSVISDTDSVVFSESYPLGGQNDFAGYGDDDCFAIASEKSSEISLYHTIWFDSYKALDSSLPSGSAYHAADAKNGVFAAEVSGDRIIIYDVLENKLLGDTVTGVGIDIHNMLFVGDKLFVTDLAGKACVFDSNCKEIGKFDVSETIRAKLKENGADAYVSMYNAELADLDGKLACGIDRGVFLLDISDEAKIDRCYINPEGKEFAAVYAGGQGISCVERNRVEKSDKIVYFDKELKMSYVLENDTDLSLPENSVSLVSHSADGKAVAFVNTEGYVGLFRFSDKKLIKFPYDNGRLSPLRLVISPDGEYVFVLGTNGELVRYSLQTFDELRCQLDVTVNEYRTTLGFNGRDMLCVSNTPSGSVVLVDIKTMEPRAEINDVVLIPENTNKAVFSLYGKGWGYYDILTGKELSDFAKKFIEKYK